MANPEHALVEPEEFLDWVFDQEGKYELDQGVVIEMMAGAREGHNVVCTNVVVSIAPQAKRGGCRTTSSDTAVRTGPNSVRFPDIVVDCGPPDPSATAATSPTMLVEVLSSSTSGIDRTDKIEEYRSLDAVRLIMLIDPGIVHVKLYRFGEDGIWRTEKYDSLDQVIDLSEVGATLAMSDIYDTLEPRHRARLAIVEPGSSP